MEISSLKSLVFVLFSRPVVFVCSVCAFIFTDSKHSINAQLVLETDSKVSMDQSTGSNSGNKSHFEIKSQPTDDQGKVDELSSFANSTFILTELGKFLKNIDNQMLITVAIVLGVVLAIVAGFTVVICVRKRCASKRSRKPGRLVIINPLYEKALQTENHSEVDFLDPATTFDEVVRSGQGEINPLLVQVPARHKPGYESSSLSSDSGTIEAVNVISNNNKQVSHIMLNRMESYPFHKRPSVVSTTNDSLSIVNVTNVDFKHAMDDVDELLKESLLLNKKSETSSMRSSNANIDSVYIDAIKDRRGDYASDMRQNSVYQSTNTISTEKSCY